MLNATPTTVLVEGRATTRLPEVTWQRILVPVDFTQASVDALKYAVAIARRDGSSLCLMHVVERVAGCDDENLFHPEHEVAKQAEQKLAHLARLVVPREIPLRILVQQGKPTAEVLQAAESLDCSAIVMGPHKHGFFRRLYDVGVARRVAERARCHVLLVNSSHSAESNPIYWEALSDKTQAEDED